LSQEGRNNGRQRTALRAAAAAQRSVTFGLFGMTGFNDLDIAPRFWQLVGEGKRNRERMEAILRGLSREDLIRFHREYRNAEQYMDERLDDFENLPSYFDIDAVGWIVSQGRAFYETIYNDPKKLLRVKEEDIDFTCHFGGSAVGVYEERFGENIPADSDERWEIPKR
jgi:hypothetical protein